MELATLEVSRDEARERLAEYEVAVRRDRNAQDEAIAMGYRAIARGMPLILLSQTVAAGGYHDNGMPKIAVVRADARECHGYWDGGDVIFSDQEVTSQRMNRGALVGQHTVRVSLPGRPRSEHNYWRAARTIVPLVPPRHRPKLGRLRSRHILWEVEEWRRVPPVDPALIKHIRGDLWAVLSTWDLTPVERAVLAM